MAPLRGNVTPRFSAASISCGMLRQASPAACGIDAVDAEHHGRIEHVAVAVAFLEIGAGEGGEIAVAGAVDKHPAEDRVAAGFGLDQQRLDAPVAPSSRRRQARESRREHYARARDQSAAHL